MTGKYDALERYLSGVPERRVTLSFQRIEDIIGDLLPNNAREDDLWWANSRNPGRAQPRAWIDAGWQVERVDLASQSVTFVRAGF
ncbi:MAG: hypothetical protein AB7R89_17115 [Dehalococcoidia bacterium]